MSSSEITRKSAGLANDERPWLLHRGCSGLILRRQQPRSSNEGEEAKEPIMQDKVVVITGASSGIGAALAKLIGRRGGRPVLCARREQELGGGRPVRRRWPCPSWRT